MDQISNLIIQSVPLKKFEFAEPLDQKRQISLYASLSLERKETIAAVVLLNLGW